MRNDLIETFAIDANLLAWPVQEANREKYQCNIPWAVLLDPTSACNLNCTGCWAAEYGHNLNLSLDDIDSIIRQGRDLGVHVYIYTGGEPLVRKKDIITLCERYPDCAFLCFTNATLIDEEFCQNMIRVKNFIPSISVEGFEEATDSRRGAGTYRKICNAMTLLKKHGLPFGVSCCYTSENADSIASEEFFDWMVDQGALFCWIFSYMPIGVDAPTSLMATSEQREHLYHFVREMREVKPLFTLDFWNDAVIRRRMHRGWAPLPAISTPPAMSSRACSPIMPTSTSTTALCWMLCAHLIFMAYYNNQPFNDNLLRPCPILDNPGKLAEMVEETGAVSTDLQCEVTGCRSLCEMHRARRGMDSRIRQAMEEPRRFSGRQACRGASGCCASDVSKYERLGKK